ncbi:unnamed protein product [Calicophoron daubneyi]|uniref:Uncharacterized protein n=1 Tax=Calicophoron daubneyi TaxID=300641 RepID=A0AAV2T6W1_CALDB
MDKSKPETGKEDVDKRETEREKILKACDHGDVKCLGEFVVGGGNLELIVDDEGRNALHHCVRSQAEEDSKTQPDLYEQCDRIKCARIIIKSEPGQLEHLDHRGFTPVHEAVVRNDMAFIQCIREFKPPISQNTSDPQASVVQHEDAIPLVSGRNAIHLAVIHCHLEMLKLLLEFDVKSFVNSQDAQGASPLHYAVQLQSPDSQEAIRILVKDGKADINVVDSHGRTPLIWASTIGSDDSVKLLLDLSAKVTLKDESGLTALHCAASRGHIRVIETILEWIKVANMDDLSKLKSFVDVPDKDGCSPLFYSVTMGHCGVTSCLLKYGANVHSRDSKGRTLGHCLARVTATDSDDAHTSLGKQLDTLLEHGLDPWKVTYNGASPLHEACLLRNAQFVLELARLADFDKALQFRDAQGHAPLHLVVAASWSEDEDGLRLCECLLRSRADVNLTTVLPNGDLVTALDLAILNEQEEGVKYGKLRKLLIEYGGKTYADLTKKPPDQERSEDISKLADASSFTDTIEVTSTAVKTDDEEPKLLQNRECQSEIKKPKIKQTKEAGTLTIASGLYADRSTSTVSQTATRRRSSQTPNTTVSSYTSSARKMSTKGMQTNRGSQTEFEFFSQDPVKFTGPSESQAKTGVQGRLSRSDDGKHHPAQRTLSASADTGKKPKNLRSDLASAKRKRATSISTKAKIPPDLQIYIERELPAILKRYMDREKDTVSPLTGRYHMPKPTLSPYLQPLIPITRPIYGKVVRPKRQGSDVFRASRQIGSVGEWNSPSKKNKLSARPFSEKKAPKSQQLASSAKRGSNKIGSSEAIAHRVHQSVADYEYCRLLEEIIKLDGMHERSGQSGPKNSKSVRNNIRKRNTNRSAMGSELSPEGNREQPPEGEICAQPRNRPKPNSYGRVK